MDAIEDSIKDIFDEIFSFSLINKTYDTTCFLKITC
jgi:hypothetical protein